MIAGNDFPDHKKCANIQATAATGIPFQFLRNLYIRKKLHAVGIRIHHVKVLIITFPNGCGLGDRVLLIRVILSLIRIVHVGSFLDVFYCDTVFPSWYLHKEFHIHGSLHRDVITSLWRLPCFLLKINQNSHKIWILSHFSSLILAAES